MRFCQYKVNTKVLEIKELRTFFALLALTAHGAVAFVAALWKHVALSRRVAWVRLTRVVRIGASWTCREKSIKEKKERKREGKKMVTFSSTLVLLTKSYCWIFGAGMRIYAVIEVIF